MNDRSFDSPDRNEQPDIDQQIRINELRETARELTGGEMTEWESDDADPDASEGFWEGVVAFERAEQTTHFEQLQRAGVELPRPEQLDDCQLSSKLWEVIDELAKIRAFMSQTDHLSDRQLYELLWHDVLHESTPDFPPNSGWNCHIDLVSSGSDEDIEQYLKYYADEEDRERWRRDFPDDEMPPHVDPPYDRDSKLPTAQ